VAASLDPDIRAFFDSYLGAFERRDAKAIAEHFRFPLHVAGDSGEVTVVSIPSAEAWIPQLERLLGLYAQLDVRTAKIREARTARFSPRLAQAAIGWALESSGGTTVYEFDATYTLVASGDALKITAIAHNEQLRAREAMAKRAAGPA
jgi:hypothetical protein